MHFNFYGGAATQDGLNNAISNLQQALAQHSSMAVGPDGNSYPVVFNVTGGLLTESAAAKALAGNVGEGFDPKQNFVRVEDGISPARNSLQEMLAFDQNGNSTGGRVSNGISGPDNSMIVAPEHLTSTTFVHEAVAHGLTGRNVRSHIDDWSSNPDSSIPSIRTHRFTRGAPSNLMLPNGQMDVSQRQVLPADKPININWSSAVPRVGGATNAFFNADGTSKIY